MRDDNLTYFIPGDGTMRHGWSAATAIVAVSVRFAAVRRATRPATASEASTGSGAMPIYSGALARLDHSLARLDAALTTRDASEVRRAFREARAAYKRVELFVEYYGPADVRALNGVPMPKAEDEDPETPLAPVGLQVVESIVFPSLDTARTTEARQLVAYMRAAVPSLSRAGADTRPGDAYLFDAMRQEITRVSTLGGAGFDASASGEAIVEAADALTGVREALVPYRQTLIWRAPAALARLDVTLDAAIAYLRAHHDFDSFDRLAFISRHAVPTARALVTAQQALAIGAPRKPRAWSAHAAGSAARQPTQFADGRARTLEDQATDAVGNATEMGGALALVANAVWRRPEYRRRFAGASGAAADTAVSARALRLAVAAYVGSLTAMNSAFDQAVRGDPRAMSAEAREGLNMHNGVFPTLESVVDFDDAGGGAGIGARLLHQTLPADSLHLTPRQKRAIIAFLMALTERTIR